MSKSSLQQPVRIVQIGVRSYSDGPRVPLWAVMLGDTDNAERIARRFKQLGPYSLNATIWTREDNSAMWARTTFRRPRNVDEAMELHENAEAFTSRQQGDVSLLPRPLRGLGANLGKIDFIVRYDDGSAKAYLCAGSSQQDAEALMAAIAEL